MSEMHGWVTAEFQSICLMDDPPVPLDGEPGEDVDDYLPPPDAPDGFDLLTAAPGIVTVTTGVMRGTVDLMIRVLDDEPSELDAGDWDTIEEIGFRALSAHTRAASGEYYPFAADRAGPFQPSVTPSGPGNYRVRAYESNRRIALGEHRDDGDPPTQERYLLEVWATRTTDENRQRLKGPQPPLYL